jgi:CheY-like chemotaxis protein
MTESKIKKQILIVEDDPAISSLIAMVLEEEGFKVETAANGREALNCLKLCVPDLILLDMKMPVMNGWQFVEEFRIHHDRLIPIVVLTAAEDANKRAQEVQADAALGKPFQLERLLEVVRENMHTGDKKKVAS